jgi:hypothetical protein
MSETICIQNNGDNYYVDLKGDILDGDESRQVTAAELERIYAAASKLRAAAKGAITGLKSDHAVSFCGEGGQMGDVMIGCQSVDYAVVVLAVKASRKMRAKKGRK